MGDPEAESVIPRIQSDLMDLFLGVAEGNIGEKEIETDPRTAAAVFLVSGGYPEAYEKGKVISGLEKVKDSILFHAGTKVDGDQVVTSGGRVIAICSFAEDMKNALELSYKNAGIVDFEKKYYRSDLGFDLV
jgi:phosphoribosylamine--glycine ligase